MFCKRCGTKMRQSPRSHHKKRKWVCPSCGRARMERTGKLRRAGRSDEP